mmetsp:Transcript_19141/g.65143  ORF Transcript_19141/g.65143 Transcript_19141/m.65143 type:complete len:173 (+) Transcript_19141:156-674(+)
MRTNNGASPSPTAQSARDAAASPAEETMTPHRLRRIILEDDFELGGTEPSSTPITALRRDRRGSAPAHSLRTDLMGLAQAQAHAQASQSTARVRRLRRGSTSCVDGLSAEQRDAELRKIASVFGASGSESFFPPGLMDGLPDADEANRSRPRRPSLVDVELPDDVDQLCGEM